MTWTCPRCSPPACATCSVKRCCGVKGRFHSRTLGVSARGNGHQLIALRSRLPLQPSQGLDRRDCQSAHNVGACLATCCVRARWARAQLPSLASLCLAAVLVAVPGGVCALSEFTATESGSRSQSRGRLVTCASEQRCRIDECGLGYSPSLGNESKTLSLKKKKVRDRGTYKLKRLRRQIIQLFCKDFVFFFIKKIVTIRYKIELRNNCYF